MKNLDIFTRKLKVLYVEDNEDSRTATLGFLFNIFDDITTAKHGRDGLDKFKEFSFDLILTDINMPKMTGIEMIEEIRKLNQDIPILVLSAYNEPSYFIETIKQGVEGYLLKPIVLKQFLHMIQKISYKIYLQREVLEYQNSLELKVQEQLTEINKKNQELENLLYYDKLTSLPNRNMLMKVLREESPYGILLIDINDFSVINDMYGSQIGDRILAAIAKLLQDLAEYDYRVFRVSGDKFAFLDMNDDQLNFTTTVVQNILSNIELGNIHQSLANENIGINISITASVSSNTKKLLKNAEIALHYAKSKKLHLVYYSDSLNLEETYKKELDSVQMVKKALEEDRIVPFFQEIVKDEKYKTYECLVRIIDNEKIISPFFFLDAIKKTKYYDLLTRVVIEKSFNTFINTNDNFTINLSFEDIVNQDTMLFIEKKLEETGLQNQLILEIVESESIDNFQIVKDFIVKMQKRGVRIAIDDFGSGYSNFVNILELNPDFIKIDGSLVKEIHENEKSFIIVKTIVGFATELGIKTIVEFVHNKDVYEKAKALNVTGFQGYYFAEPLREIK